MEQPVDQFNSSLTSRSPLIPIVVSVVLTAVVVGGGIFWWANQKQNELQNEITSLNNQLQQTSPTPTTTGNQSTPASTTLTQSDLNRIFELSKKELIRELDQRFSVAIKSEYDKDVELGLKHLTTLSGGLDSRMNILFAKKMGYKDIHALTFSQSNYLDDTISMEIAADNNFQRAFISLDNGDYLKDFMGPSVANGGLASYFSGAAAFYALSFINMNSFGLLHSGQLGDAILGTYLTEPRPTKPKEEHLLKMALSKKFYAKLPEEDIQKVIHSYNTIETLKFYERGVNYIFNGNVMIHQYTEHASPFLYYEFIDFAFRISPEYKYREFVYIDWINSKLKIAANYKWEKFKLKPVSAYFNNYLYFLPRIKKSSYILLNKLNVRPSYNMNPFEYWASGNMELTNLIDRYIKEHFYLIEKYPDLAQDASSLIAGHKFIGKGLLITILLALDHYMN